MIKREARPYLAARLGGPEKIQLTIVDVNGLIVSSPLNDSRFTRQQDFAPDQV